MDHYTIRLTGPSFSLERLVNVELVKRVVELVLDSEGEIVPITGDVGVRQQSDSAVVSETRGTGYRGDSPDLAVADYVRFSGAKSNTEKIVAIGLWLETDQELKSFTRRQVKDQFRDLGERPPQNIPRDFQTVVSLDWLAPDRDNPNKFWVTAAGRRALQGNFTGEFRSRAVRRARLRRKK